MKVAIYARVSTAGQEQQKTVEQQLIACRDHCLKNEWEVVTEFKDEAVSGSTPFHQRLAGGQLLEALATKQVDGVVILCADRLARDTLEALLVMRSFKRLKATVEFVSQSFDETQLVLS